MNYYSVILMYTFVDNKELDAEFLRLIKQKYTDCSEINESTYAINCIDFRKLACEIKNIYHEAIMKYPSKGRDRVSIMYAAMLADIKIKEKSDKIVEYLIIGTANNQEN